MPDPFVLPDQAPLAYHSGVTGRYRTLRDGRAVLEPVGYEAYRTRLISRLPAAVAQDMAIGVRVLTFETGKYRPPFDVTIRTSADGWNAARRGHFVDGIWVFRLPDPVAAGDLQLKLLLGDNFWMVGPDVQVPNDQTHWHLTDSQVYFTYQVRFRTSRWRPNNLITLRNSADGWWRDVFGVFRGDTWLFQLDRANYPDPFRAKLVAGRAAYMDGPDLDVSPAKAEYPLDDSTVRFPVSPSGFDHGYDNFLSVETPLEDVTVRAAGTESELYDVVVIGSGMGGGILADELSDRGARVLVLDAGGFWMPVHSNELPGSDVNLAERDQLGSFVNSSGSDLFPGVLFNLGGRSVYWSGLIPRMRDWELGVGWPASVRDYLTQSPGGRPSGYERAEALMRKGKTLGPFQDRVRGHLAGQLGGHYSVIDLPRSYHQPNLTTGNQLDNVLQKSTGVFSTADLLLDSLGYNVPAGRTNLRVNLHHLATRIETTGRSATAVVCQDLVGNVERRYTGQVVVLACGSLESPKLALQSGLSDPNRKMGRGLTDHPAYFYKIEHVLPRSGALGWIGDPHGHAKILIQVTRATADRHPYNVELLINPKYWDARHADDDVWRQLVDSEQVSKVQIKFIFNSPLDDGNGIRPRGPGQKPEVYVRHNDRGLGYHDEMVQVRNRVLTALGVPAAELSAHWVDDQWGLGIHGSVHHAGGTLRMSDAGDGVVDDKLQFLTYDNLYCCDVSVFPSIPAANPSLTLAALAQRLTDTLATRLGLPPAR